MANYLDPIYTQHSQQLRQQSGSQLLAGALRGALGSYPDGKLPRSYLDLTQPAGQQPGSLLLARASRGALGS